MKETRVVIEVDLVKITFLGVLFGVLAALAMGRARADDRQVVVVVGLTCLDIQALAGWKGWDEIERRATAAGQTKEQIKRAKACLK